jgi:hypothetical protein
MTSYTFVCLGGSGEIGAIERQSCADDKAAMETARALFVEHPSVRIWPNCRVIEVTDGDRLVARVEREAAPTGV